MIMQRKITVAEKVDMNRLMPALEQTVSLRRINATMLSMASSNQPGERQWFVLHVMTGREKAVESALVAGSVQSYLPTQEQGKRVVRRRVVAGGTRPALPGYVLVSVVPSAAAFAGLIRLDGVIGLVGGAEKPHRVSDKDVARFKVLIGDAHAVEAARQEFEKGDRVRFEIGPFAGFEGRIAKVRMAKGKRGEKPIAVDAIVEVTIMGQSHAITTPLALLEKL